MWFIKSKKVKELEKEIAELKAYIEVLEGKLRNKYNARKRKANKENSKA